VLLARSMVSLTDHRPNSMISSSSDFVVVGSAFSMLPRSSNTPPPPPRPVFVAAFLASARFKAIASRMLTAGFDGEGSSSCIAGGFPFFAGFGVDLVRIRDGVGVGGKGDAVRECDPGIKILDEPLFDDL
jgi:hypothetical protein